MSEDKVEAKVVKNKYGILEMLFMVVLVIVGLVMQCFPGSSGDFAILLAILIAITSARY